MRGSMASRTQALLLRAAPSCVTAAGCFRKRASLARGGRVNRQPRKLCRIPKRFGGCGSNPSQQQRPRDGRNAISGSWSRRRDLRLWRRAPVNSPPGCPVCAHPICFRAIRAQTARSPLAPPPSNPVDVRNNEKESRQKPAPFFVVEATGFEPTTSWSRTKRATKLRYASNGEYYIKPNALLQAILSRCIENPARRERGKVRKTIRDGPVSRVLSSAVIYLRPPSPAGSSVIHGSARTGSPYEQSPNLHRTGFTWHGALPSRR